MADYRELMAILSVPRPNGSRAERETARALKGWLARRKIPYRTHTFRLYPFFFEATGLWLILSRVLLALAVWLRWGWRVLAIALAGLAGGLLDTALHVPLVTWPGARKGENILVEFAPSAREAGRPTREILLSAHYDSKTELLDHKQRMFFLTRLPHGIALTVLVGLLGFADRLLAVRVPILSTLAFAAGSLLSLPLLYLAGGMGLNLTFGRLVRPSQGAVDNGAACAVLLGLAEALAAGTPGLVHTRVTLALFAGEEVNMQGSRAYVRGRKGALPAIAVNLEVLGQDGGYVYWERDGNAFRLVPTTPEVTRLLCESVLEVTGQPAEPAGPINSDGSSFLTAGIPTAVFGSVDSRLGISGFHRPTDHLGRVSLPRLPEAAAILAKLIEKYDSQPF